MELPTPKRDQLMQQMLMALAFAIPWAKRAIPTIIAIVIVIALFQFFRKKKADLPAQPFALMVLLALFMLLVCGTTYSQHPDEAWNEIGIKLSFLIFPLLSLLVPSLTARDLKNIQNAFVGGCFLFIGITLSHAAWVLHKHPDWYYITYDRLSWYLHPTYAATYQAFAIFFLTHDCIENSQSSKRYWLNIVMIVILLASIVLLSSKAGYLCVILVLFFSVYKAVQKGIAVKKIAIYSLIAAALFASTILALPTTSERVKTAVHDMRESENSINDSNAATTSRAEHTSSTSMRLITWSASWKILSENPFGTGTGDTQHQLNSLYVQKGEHYAATRQFNAHNQFLQTGAEIGWLGFLAVITLLVALWGIGQKEPSAQIFSILCALNFLFESFLEVQAGIVFFSFWILVFSRIKR